MRFRDRRAKLTDFVDQFFRHLFRLAYRAGALGLLTVGVLDSSFLMLPLGNDFLLMGLSARHANRVVLYVAAATVGSVCGVFLTLWLSNKAGDKLSKGRKGRAWKYVEKQMKEKAGWVPDSRQPDAAAVSVHFVCRSRRRFARTAEKSIAVRVGRAPAAIQY